MQRVGEPLRLARICQPSALLGINLRSGRGWSWDTVPLMGNSCICHFKIMNGQMSRDHSNGFSSKRILLFITPFNRNLEKPWDPHVRVRATLWLPRTSRGEQPIRSQSHKYFNTCLYKLTLWRNHTEPVLCKMQVRDGGFLKNPRKKIFERSLDSARTALVLKRSRSLSIGLRCCKHDGAKLIDIQRRSVVRFDDVRYEFHVQ